jgi:nucleotide-binding universal stress UspA family protein
MLRTIHIALDGSKFSDAALALALKWAKAFGAKVVGQAPIDEPFITEAEAMPMGGAYFQGHRDEAKLAEVTAKAKVVLDNFMHRCADAGVAAVSVLDVGEPVELIRRQAETADVTLLGLETFFHFTASRDPCGTSDEVMHHPPRPVVVVPEIMADGSSIVVAYDGSAEAARALLAFEATGLGARSPGIVASVNENATEAEATAKRGVEYLTSHGVAATARAITATKPVGEHILDEVKAANAQLLVMGAFSHSALHQFVFGSTTKTVLHKVPVPVFLFH